MKITGAEFNEWYDNHWPGKDWYLDNFEDDIFGDDDALDESVIYDTGQLGNIYWQGDRDKHSIFFFLPLDKTIRKWRRDRDTFTISATGPKGTRDDAIAALKALGCKVK